MSAALYDPGFGYYTRNIRTVGKRGDFSTSATLSDALARGIAQWLKKNMRETGIRHVIEVGGGDGSLAEGILANVGFLRRRALRSYTIVDVSDPLIALQKERLSKFRTMRWSDSMSSALENANGTALIFSNEAVDAFPADVFRWCDRMKCWERLSICFENVAEESFQTVDQDSLAPSSVFEHNWPDGQRVEVQSSYRDWQREWSDKLTKGRILTIDYGDTCPEIYYRRPNGSLRAYFHQTMLEGTTAIAQNPGKQDITADVNFTDIQNWGNEIGMKTVSLQSQGEFLKCQGISEDRYTRGFGPGTAFKVLEQEKQTKP